MEIIGRYKIISRVASGGMANIYLAYDIDGKEVAIKLLKEEESDKEKILERFNQEGLFKLNHENIVKIIDAGNHNNRPFIVMQYIEGYDLEEYIKKNGLLSTDKALDIFNQILSALLYVHKLGLIHRDIKPKNIIIDKNGVAFITDFGIAKSISSHIKTSTGAYLGAPAYSSPEQMNGDAVDKRTDIYSIGVTLYEMLTGAIPYSSTSIDVIINEKFLSKYIPISERKSNIPAYIVYLINKCMSKKPSDRFGSIEEIKSYIDKNTYSATLIKEKIKKPKSQNKKQKIKIAISIGIVILVFIIASLILILRFGNLFNINSIKENLTEEATAQEITLQTEVTETSADEAAATRSAGLSEFGLVDVGDEWIFYSNYNDNNKLYKIKTGGTERQKISDDKSYFINVSGDWIYYSNYNDVNNLYRIKKDGTEKQKLNDDKTYFIRIEDSWIYYVNYSDNGYIYRINADGDQREKISGRDSWNLCVSGEWIYFSGYPGYRFYKVKTDGTGEKKLIDRPINGLIAENDWVYYSSGWEGIFKLNNQNTEIVQLTNDYARFLNKEDDWIYYVNASDGKSIYKIKPDGTDREKILNDEVEYMYVENGLIFYLNAIDEQLYRIKIDGTGEKMLDLIEINTIEDTNE